MTLVSICVVTYNQDRYIKRCLQSLLDQKTNFQYEVIVGDDCSTDKTCKIVETFTKEHPDIFKAIFHKKNSGLYGAENYRSVHFSASGKYIAHVDGDDYWAPEKLQTQVDFMEKHNEILAVYTNAIVESDSGDYLGVFASGVKGKFDLQYLIEFRNFLPASSMLYRRNKQHLIVPKNGEFVDFQVHINIAQQGEIGFIDNNLLSYTYQSSTSLLANNNPRVRRLTWEALCGINPCKIDVKSINTAKMVFIIESTFISILNFNFYNLKYWYKNFLDILSNLSNKEKFVVIIMSFKNISKKVYLRIKNKITQKTTGRIFYVRS